jgi:hypothetical protein
MSTAPQSYVDMEITLERLGDEIECIDHALGEHISRGVQVKDLMSLARLRANLSIKRVNLINAMDREASVTEVHFNVEERNFDVESTLNGQRGFITLETIR